MHDRSLWFLTGSFALCTTLHAQSNVRPIPKSTLPPEWTFELARDRRSREEPSGTPTESTIAATSADAPRVDIRIHGQDQPAAGFDGAPGSVAVQHGGWDAQIGYGVGTDRAFAIQLETEATFYKFHDATTIVPGTPEPFNDVYETSVGTSLFVANGAATSWFTGLRLSLSGEDDAKVGQALWMSGVTGVQYQPRDNVAFLLGVAAETRLEDQPWIIPFLGLHWDIDERWKFMADGWRVRIQGELGDGWTVVGEALYESRQYRLNEDGPLPDGVARDEQITVGPSVKWKVADGVTFSVNGGIIAWQELTILDKDGHQVSETETMSGTYFGFGLDLSF